jgi:hypothetical protein
MSRRRLATSELIDVSSLLSCKAVNQSVRSDEEGPDFEQSSRTLRWTGMSFRIANTSTRTTFT